MDKPKKIIYKVKYEFEFEITREINEQGKFSKPSPELTLNEVEKKILAYNFTPDDEIRYGLLSMCNYMEAHFPNELCQVYNQLVMESTFLENKENREGRNVFIAELLKITEARSRKRIKAKAGRIPNKMKIDWNQEEYKFVAECEEILKTLQSESVKKSGSVKINKTALAGRMFIKSNNPLRDLKKKLDLYEISFDELKAKFTKNDT